MNFTGAAGVVKRFNSRLREEATLPSPLCRRHPGGFNSRLREEATGVRRDKVSKQRVSTHASVRRRHRLGLLSIFALRFQLTPP